MRLQGGTRAGPRATSLNRAMRRPRILKTSRLTRLSRPRSGFCDPLPRSHALETRWLDFTPSSSRRPSFLPLAFPPRPAGHALPRLYVHPPHTSFSHSLTRRVHSTPCSNDRPRRVPLPPDPRSLEPQDARDQSRGLARAVRGRSSALDGQKAREEDRRRRGQSLSFRPPRPALAGADVLYSCTRRTACRLKVGGTSRRRVTSRQVEAVSQIRKSARSQCVHLSLDTSGSH